MRCFKDTPNYTKHSKSTFSRIVSPLEINQTVPVGMLESASTGYFLRNKSFWDCIFLCKNIFACACADGDLFFAKLPFHLICVY